MHTTCPYCSRQLAFEDDELVALTADVDCPALPAAKCSTRNLWTALHPLLSRVFEQKQPILMTLNRLISILMLALFAGTSLHAQQWTNTAGVAIQGPFVKLQGESVVILLKGKETLIPLASLSLESRQQAKNLAGKKAGLITVPQDPIAMPMLPKF